MFPSRAVGTQWFDGVWRRAVCGCTNVTDGSVVSLLNVPRLVPWYNGFPCTPALSVDLYLSQSMTHLTVSGSRHLCKENFRSLFIPGAASLQAKNDSASPLTSQAMRLCCRVSGPLYFSGPYIYVHSGYSNGWWRITRLL